MSSGVPAWVEDITGIRCPVAAHSAWTGRPSAFPRDPRRQGRWPPWRGYVREVLVHGIPDPVGQSRVAAKDAGRHFFDPGTPRARARRCKWRQGRALAPALQPGIGAQPDKGRIEAVVVPTMGQAIGPARVGQVQLEDIER